MLELQKVSPATDEAAVADVPPLPLSVTANDIRCVIQYLKRRPEGVTLGEAMDAIKRQVFEREKITAYEALGLITSTGDRMVLAELGSYLADGMEPEISIFRIVLNRIEPYREALRWTSHQPSDFLTHNDVGNFWRENYPEALGINTPKMIEGSAICFFQLCQAAALGTHIIGKKGQPTRLRIDRGELAEFMVPQEPELMRSGFKEHSLTTVLRPVPRALSGSSRYYEPRYSSQDYLRIYVCGEAQSEICRSVIIALDLADVECFVSRSKVKAVTLVSSDTLQNLKNCSAAIFIISSGDFESGADGEKLLRQSIRIELAAADAVYDRRVILLLEEGLAIPPDLRELESFHYNRCGLDWEIGVRLIRAVKSFNHANTLNKNAGKPPREHLAS